MNRTIQPPAHVLVEECATGPMWMEDGIVVISNRVEKYTMQEAIKNVLRCSQLTGGVRRPLLVDITAVRSISREAREYYASEAGASTISALALLTNSKVCTFIGNFFIGMHKTSVPRRLFTSADEAKAWLKKYTDPGFESAHAATERAAQLT